MRTKCLAIILFFITLSVYGQSNRTVSLDEALGNAVVVIENRINQGAAIIVYQFQSENEKISDYVLNELFDRLVNTNQFRVLSRESREVADAEIGYQFGAAVGFISDESLSSLSSRLGAQGIITGSLDDVGNEFRFRVRVIGTGTTEAIASYTISVNKNDRQIAALSPSEKNTGEKIVTGAMNILFGLGSYLEGDIFGGLTITGGFTIAAVLMVIEAAALDWDSPAVGVPATTGVIIAGLTMVYGFARPFIYNYSPQMAALMDNTQPKIVLTSDSYENRNIGFQISHTVKF